MTTDIQKIHEDIRDLKRDLSEIKKLLKEQLSGYAIKQLEIARETPDSEYADLE